LRYLVYRSKDRRKQEQLQSALPVTPRYQQIRVPRMYCACCPRQIQTNILSPIILRGYPSSDQSYWAIVRWAPDSLRIQKSRALDKVQQPNVWCESESYLETVWLAGEVQESEVNQGRMY